LVIIELVCRLPLTPFELSGDGARSRPADRHGDVAAVTGSGAPTPIFERGSHLQPKAGHDSHL